MIAFDDDTRAQAHARIDLWMALYGLERHTRSAHEYKEIDALAVSERVRGASKRPQ